MTYQIERFYPGTIHETTTGGGKTIQMLCKGTVTRGCGCQAILGFKLPLPGDLVMGWIKCGNPGHESLLLHTMASHQKSHEERPELEDMDALEVTKLLMKEIYDG